MWINSYVGVDVYDAKEDSSARISVLRLELYIFNDIFVLLTEYIINSTTL